MSRFYRTSRGRPVHSGHRYSGKDFEIPDTLISFDHAHDSCKTKGTRGSVSSLVSLGSLESTPFPRSGRPAWPTPEPLQGPHKDGHVSNGVIKQHEMSSCSASGDTEDAPETGRAPNKGKKGPRLDACPPHPQQIVRDNPITAPDMLGTPSFSLASSRRVNRPLCYLLPNSYTVKVVML